MVKTVANMSVSEIDVMIKMHYDMIEKLTKMKNQLAPVQTGSELVNQQVKACDKTWTGLDW